MTDPLDPTPDDLRRWAYTPDAEYAAEMSQDWDFCVATIDRAELLVELASDCGCLLTCLYVLVGDSVRMEHCRHGIPRLLDEMRPVPPDAPEDVQLWVRRAHDLITHPESFDDNNWRRGDLARADDGA